MAARIVAIEERCPHGRTDECGEPICHECSGPYSHAKTCSHAGRGREGTYPCAGGSRRVLDPGSYVLIEKVDGEWPEWIEDEDFKLAIHDVMRRLFINFAPIWRNTTATSHQHPNYAPSLVSEILDALAGAES